jgi:hypothetical protein
MLNALYDWHSRKSALLATAGVWTAGIVVAIAAMVKVEALGPSISNSSAAWLYGPAAGEGESSSTEPGAVEVLPEDHIVVAPMQRPSN